jgi:ribulose bisphosphate carboxylase small subunit
MARKTEHPTAIAPTEGFEIGLEFLRARRAQNLSWMRFVEQSFSSMADLQRTTGTTGDALSRLWTAQAAFVRDTARVYRSATTHLAR